MNIKDWNKLYCTFNNYYNYKSFIIFNLSDNDYNYNNVIVTIDVIMLRYV